MVGEGLVPSRRLDRRPWSGGRKALPYENGTSRNDQQLATCPTIRS